MRYDYGYDPLGILASNPHLYSPMPFYPAERYMYRGPVYPPLPTSPARIGIVPVAADAAPDVTKDTVGFLATIPQLLAIGVVTGAAFAIGNGLVSRFLFKPKRG